ncbi:hypothetical protein KY333_01445 [Candidatus Woesearchaeota archaeon]|nr:hypothetical protein [Candidatus Woesearchaeota archaeon]
MKKKFPTALIVGAAMLAVLLGIFVVRKSTITGRATSGIISTLTASPISTGLITAVAAASMLLIVIFAGIGKEEH